MKIAKAFLYYLRSNTNAGLSILLLAAIAVTILFGLSAIIPIISFVVYLLISGTIFFSRRGAEAIVQERNEDFEEKSILGIERAAQRLKKLSGLRLPSGNVDRALKMLIVNTRRSIDYQRQEKFFLPKTENILEDSLNAVSACLRELDRSSLECRFGEGSEGRISKDIEKRTAEYLLKKANEIREDRLSQLPQKSDLDSFESLEEIDQGS
jgi:hypothetical protein